MHAYSTATGDQRPGWDAFDHLVQQAASRLSRPTVDTVAAELPAGISFHLIETTLRRATTNPGAVRYLPRTHQRHSQPAAA